MLRSTDLADWMIVPLEIVWSDWEAAIAERYWWDKFRKWCLNDVPLGFPTSSAKPSKLMPQRPVQTIRSLTAARLANDYPRIAALKKEIASIGAELQLPLLLPAIVRVPYMTRQQKLAISWKINALLRHVPYTSWERQALCGRIRVVRTVPHTVRRCFESEANSCEKEWERPPCHCTPEFIDLWEQGGTVTVRDGHFCLLPVSVQFDGAELRSKDPLPLAVQNAKSRRHPNHVPLIRGGRSWLRCLLASNAIIVAEVQLLRSILGPCKCDGTNRHLRNV